MSYIVVRITIIYLRLNTYRAHIYINMYEFHRSTVTDRIIIYKYCCRFIIYNVQLVFDFLVKPYEFYRSSNRTYFIVKSTSVPIVPKLIYFSDPCEHFHSYIHLLYFHLAILRNRTLCHRPRGKRHRFQIFPKSVVPTKGEPSRLALNVARDKI